MSTAALPAGAIPQKANHRLLAVTTAILPALIGCGAFLAVFAAVFIKTVQSLGHWYYPLDDAYIDMSLAKHLALYGVWGTSHEFGSGASSPGYTVLLAAVYRIFGVHDCIPLLLASGCCLGIIFAAARLLRFASLRLQVAGVLLVVALTPVWTMATLGMEHALQILLSLLFLDLAVSRIAFQKPFDWRILAASSLMVSVRYEGLFVIAGASLVLLIQRRWGSVTSLLISAAVPVLLFGFYFHLYGGKLLPNSVLLKGGASVYRILGFVLLGFHMAPAMLAATWVAWRYRRSIAGSRAKAAIGITVIALWLHFAFASYGWSYRYEAYLIALVVLSWLLLYAEGLLSIDVQQVALLGLGFLACHAMLATVTLPGRSRGIYSQQFQTARLLSIYPVATAINDLGAPTYFTDTPVLDIVGLGSQDVFKARYHHPYTTDVLEGLLHAHHVQTVAIYDKWFSAKKNKVLWGGPPLPPDYVPVAKLRTSDPHHYLGSDAVSYYALKGTETQLEAALKQLRRDLPAQDNLSFER
jgi:hypothetical protein